MKYTFTRHALSRFRDRFPDRMVGSDSKLSVAIAIKDATPDNTIHNDTKFMTEYYEKYGYDKTPIFLVSRDIVFVIKGENLVTLYSRNESRFKPVRQRFKSNRRK